MSNSKGHQSSDCDCKISTTAFEKVPYHFPKGKLIVLRVRSWGIKFPTETNQDVVPVGAAELGPDDDATFES